MYWRSSCGDEASGLNAALDDGVDDKGLGLADDGVHLHLSELSSNTFIIN